MKLTTIKSIVAAALVVVGFTAAAGAVYPERVDKVQLWEGGPYFATCNIDATTPQGYGSRAMFSQTAGVVEDRLGGLGEGWRVPTAEDMAGLTNNCTCAWTDNYNSTGVPGTIVTSKDDPAKSIFFPAAGADWTTAVPEGYYWTSTPRGEDYPEHATAVKLRKENGVEYFYLTESQWVGYYMSIRPVRDAPTPLIDEVRSVYLWDGSKGAIKINYSLTKLDTRKKYKVAFDITANGMTRGVTNDAASLVVGRQPTKTIDTTALFGSETIDEAAEVKISLIEIRSPAEPDDCTTTKATFWLGPTGGEDTPWVVGENATAYVKGGTLYIKGTGPVTSMPWADNPAGITKLVKDEGVTELNEIVETLSDIKNVNGLALTELNGLAVAALKASGFSAIAVDPATQEATLSVVISKAESLDEPKWKPVATNDVPVKADTPAGFFIVAPLAK